MGARGGNQPNLFPSAKDPVLQPNRHLEESERTARGTGKSERTLQRVVFSEILESKLKTCWDTRGGNPKQWNRVNR